MAGDPLRAGKGRFRAVLRENGDLDPSGRSSASATPTQPHEKGEGACDGSLSLSPLVCQFDDSVSAIVENASET
jgi:hypothetical protein